MMTKEDIGAVLKKLRIDSGMTQKEAAEKLGRKQQIVGHWETGYAQPDANTLFALCEIYGATVDEAFGFVRVKKNVSPVEYDLIKKYRDLDNHGREHINSVLEWETKRMAALSDMQKQLNEKEMHISKLKITELPTRIITYYQKLASAGNGEYLFDDVPTDMIKVVDNELSDRADFVIGVNGDSMEPTYYDGDKVYVSKTDSIPVGSIGIFTRGNECFIKELGNNCLISHNKKYNDIPANDEIRLVGEVLGKVVEE